MNKIRVLVVDDHPLMRDALRHSLLAEPDIEVVGEGMSGPEAVELARALTPDIILIDLYLPGFDGIQATRAILEDNPGARIIVITSSGEEEDVLNAVRAGAVGYVTKDASRMDVLQGVRSVVAGNRYLPPHIADMLANAIRVEEEIAKLLTPREIEVLRLVGTGKSNRDIAEALVVGEATVRAHVASLMQKLGLRNRGQLVLYASKAYPSPGPA